jgi:hypothetical protein
MIKLLEISYFAMLKLVENKESKYVSKRTLDIRVFLFYVVVYQGFMMFISRHFIAGPHSEKEIVIIFLSGIPIFWWALLYNKPKAYYERKYHSMSKKILNVIVVLNFFILALSAYSAVFL